MRRPYLLAQQRREQLLSVFLPQRIQPQLRVIGLVPPLVPILGTIVHQQEDTRCRYTFAEKIKECLGLAVQPVQVFKNESERLVETLAHQQPLDGCKCPSLA